MGAMKNQLIELMNAGASNLYTTIADFKGYGTDKYEYTNFKGALAKVQELKSADLNHECSFYIKALNLRTMRSRYVKKLSNGKIHIWNVSRRYTNH